jgi:hypothetical protein
MLFDVRFSALVGSQSVPNGTASSNATPILIDGQTQSGHRTSYLLRVLYNIIRLYLLPAAFDAFVQ